MKAMPQENLLETDFSSPELTDLTNSLFFEEHAPHAGGEKFIVFFLDDELYAVSAGKVAEVIQPLAVTPLPNVPEWLLGIANLRGEIISVVDLQKFWNKKPSEISTKTKLIVLRAGRADSIAFTVDKLSEIINLPKDAIEICEENASHIFGKASLKSSALKLIDSEKLIASLEFQT